MYINNFTGFLMRKKNISVVYEELSHIFSTQLARYDYELLFVNDGSIDASWHEITTLAHKDSRVRGLCFSRNFGHQIALSAGYDHAKGDAVISMDTDMQHPPHLIVSIIEKWEQGADIVYVRSINRSDGVFKKVTAALYYQCLDAISEVKMPRHVADFRLIDKKVVQVLRQSREKYPYWRGMVAWSGFKQAFIDCEYSSRRSGKTGYTFKKMLKLAFDGMTGFSMFPLKIAAFVGVFVIGSGSLMFLYITCDALLNKIYYPLFKWLVTIIYIFMGVQFLLMWLLGEYIGRIYEQEKGRPLYIIAEKMNV